MAGVGSNEEKAPSPEAARAGKLADDVLALVPELPRAYASQTIGAVIEQATGIVRETEEEHFSNSGVPDAQAVVSILIQGALAVVCEGHERGDVRRRLYDAGRAVGEYVTERMQENVARALREREEQAKKERS